MDKSFREYCEEVVSKLNELDVDNEFSFTVEDLLNGDPFQELMNGEADKLRKDFYKNVQKYSATLPSKANAKKELAVYKAQLDFINARIAELENHIELERSIKLDNWYLEHKDTYNEERFQNKLKEDQSAYEKAKIIYQDNLDLISAQYNSAKDSYTRLSAELEPIEVKYNTSRENYIVAHYVNNMTKEALEKIVKRQDYINSLEAVYNVRKDPAIKAIIDKEKKSVADKDIAEYYKKAYENYDNLKGANLEILKAQMDLDRLIYEDKKRELTKAKRNYTKAERLIGLDLSKFDDVEELKAYKNKLELQMLDLSSINTVNKNNVNLLAQAIIKNEELEKSTTKSEIVEASAKAAENNDKNNVQPEQTAEEQEQANVKPDTKKDEPAQPVIEPVNKPEQQANSVAMNMNYFGVKKIENCSKKIADRLIEKKSWIGKCVSAARIDKAKKAGLLTDAEIAAIDSAKSSKIPLSNNEAYWKIVKEASARLDMKKVNDKLGEDIRDSREKLFHLENQYANGNDEEKRALKVYDKIKNLPAIEVDYIKTECGGDLRAYDALNVQAKIDEAINSLTKGEWYKYQDEHNYEIVLSTDTDKINKLGVTDSKELESVRFLLNTRNDLQLLINNPKLYAAWEANNHNEEECLKDPDYVAAKEQSKKILKEERFVHKDADGKLRIYKLESLSTQKSRDMVFNESLDQMLEISTKFLKNNKLINSEEELKVSKETSREDFNNAVVIWDKVDRIKKDLEAAKDKKLKDSDNYQVYEVAGDQNVSSGRAR